MPGVLDFRLLNGFFVSGKGGEGSELGCTVREVHPWVVSRHRVRQVDYVFEIVHVFMLCAKIAMLDENVKRTAFSAEFSKSAHFSVHICEKNALFLVRFAIFAEK